MARAPAATRGSAPLRAPMPARRAPKSVRRPSPQRLSHLDAALHPRMVDVGAKPATHRIAEAEARLRLPPDVARALRGSGHRTRKGPVFDTAILAGVMAAKRTAELIPLCHPLPIEQCHIEIGFAASTVVAVRCRVEVRHKTGVEMEALTGAVVAALTIYDMCKALSHAIRIGPVHLLSKSGGKRRIGRARPGESARRGGAAGHSRRSAGRRRARSVP